MTNRYYSAISQESAIESSSFWINGILTLTLVLFGICGNLLMIITLGCNTKRWLPLYYYFMTFAVWNTTLLLATVFFYSLSALQPNHIPYHRTPIFAYLNLIGYPLANSGMTATVWLILCLTVERCLVVSRPFQRIVSQTKRRAKLVTRAISILAPIYSIPLLFELRVREINELENATEFIYDNNTLEIVEFYDVVKTGLRDDRTYRIIYRVVCNLIFLSVVPFVIVVGMSGRIVFVIRQRRSEDAVRCPWLWRSESPPRRKSGLIEYNSIIQETSMDQGSDRECLRGQQRRTGYYPNRKRSRASYDHGHRTHVTLTILAVKYVICYTLPTLLNILEIVIEPKSLREMGLGLMVDLSDLMVVADSALNAFVYFSWRRKIQVRGLSFRSKNKAAQRNLLRQSSMGNEEKKRRVSQCGKTADENR